MKYSSTIRKEFIRDYQEALRVFFIGHDFLLEQYADLPSKSDDWHNNLHQSHLTHNHILIYLDATRDNMETLEFAQWNFNDEYRCYVLHLKHRYYDKFVVNFELNDDNLAVMLKLSI